MAGVTADAIAVRVRARLLEGLQYERLFAILWFAMSAVRMQTLEPRVREMTPRVHAIMAEYSELVCAFEDSGAWQGAGMRSCTDWLVVHAGFDRHTAESLLRAGHAARELPEIGEAGLDFWIGQASVDLLVEL